MTGGPTLQGLIADLDEGSIKSLSDSKLGGLVDRLVKCSDDYRDRTIARRCMRSLAFFLGYQHIMWSSKHRRFYPMPLKHEQRHTANLFRSRIMVMVSSFTSHRPKFSVIAEEQSSLSRSDTRVSDLILANLWYESRFTSRNIGGAMQRALFGGAWWRAAYHSEIGQVGKLPVFAMNMDGTYAADRDGNKVQLTDKNGELMFEWSKPIGEVRAELLSVFDVGFPPSAREPVAADLPWVNVKIPVPVAELKAKWGLSVAPSSDAVDPLMAMQAGISESYGTYLDPDQLADTLAAYEGANCAFETQLYLPHSNQNGFEGGMVLTVVDGKVVDRAEGALDTGELPFEYQPAIPVPLRFNGETSAFDMCDPQMQYNWALSDIAEQRREAMRPLVVYPELAIDTREILSGRRMLARKQGHEGALQVVETNQLTPAVMTELGNHLANVDRTAAQFPFTRGEMMGASPQPVGTIQALQAADVSDLQPGMDLADEAQGRLGAKMLALVRANYSEDRLALVTTDDAGDVAGFMYSRSSLPRRLRVTVRPRSSLRDTNKDALRTSLGEIAKSGVFGEVTQDPKFTEYLLEVMDAPAPEQYLTVSNLGYRRQEREIEEMIATEQAVPLGPFDRHPQHLAVLERLTNTGRWDQLSDGAKQACLDHSRMHQEAEAAIQQAQMQQVLAMQQAQAGIVPPAAPQGERTPTGLPVPL